MLVVPIAFEYATLLDPGDRVFLAPRRSADTRPRRSAPKATPAFQA